MGVFGALTVMVAVLLLADLGRHARMVDEICNFGHLPLFGVSSLVILWLLGGRRWPVRAQGPYVGAFFAATALGVIMEIAQVMAGNENAGAFADADFDFGDFGVAVGRGVGSIQQCPYFHAVFAAFNTHIYRIRSLQIIQCSFGAGVLNECMNLFVFKTNIGGVFCISSHAFYPEQHQVHQRADIFILE